MRLPLFTLLALLPCSAQTEAGAKLFESRCAFCHGGDGAGGERGPAIQRRVVASSDRELSDLIRDGVPAKGMPGVDLPAGELQQLVTFTRTLRRRRAAEPSPRPVAIRLRDGRTLRGLLKNESNFDLQLQGFDGRLYRLLRAEVADVAEPAGDAVRVPAVAPPPRPGDWPSYHGDLGGNRHSPLRQIHAGNIASLAPRWMFPIAGTQRLQTTPLVIDGVMYVTAVNEAYALDARTGRAIWHYQRPRTQGLAGDAASGINRGVAVRGGGVFLVTDNAHLLALDRLDGHLLWDVEMADSRQNYGATSAPLAVNDLVVSGISGGDEGVRGFLAAYQASTGKRAWRFWTVPAPGEPLAETWAGSAIPHGCASTWLTGTYDPGLDLLYWPTGNPCPDYNGDERRGDNLYSDSVLALKPETGKLQWFYQYTPHDLHDWDAQQTPMLIDTQWRGRPRKLLAQANRNGFFYVLDRATGELLLASPFVKKLTWASGIGADGRPKVVPEATPTPAGVKTCPAVEGATNWFSTAFNPELRLFYVQALEKCNIYSKAPATWEAGKSYYGGTTRQVPGEPGQKVLRALDIETGKIIWEVPQIGPGNAWGGVLSTAGGVVFYGDDSGAFAAADAKTGKPLWHFHAGVLWKASPMTYVADGRQYVAVAAGSNIIAFGL